MISEWWRYTSIYHIYPRSFCDTTGNGVGDITGITGKLDYVKNLGFETIWLSPVFQSPGRDHGYDVSDYYTVDPLFGNNELLDKLIEEVHNRNMKIVFDLVMNHTSEEHPWFKESRSSKESPQRDWYIWAQGRGKKKPPTNWKTMVGKGGWTFDTNSKEWFYSSFLNFQPDLNYLNPEVKEAMFQVADYWLKKGVDGFRLDIFNCIGKDPLLRNNPFCFRFLPTADDNKHCFWQNKIHNFNHPLSLSLAKELRKRVDTYPGRFLLGEVCGSHKLLKKYQGTNGDGLNLVFLFELINFSFKKSYFQKFLLSMEKDFTSPRLPVLTFSNHDRPRGISRVNNSLEKARILTLFQLTARGVPVTYYGEEIGMMNHNLPVKNSHDPLTENYSWVPQWLSKLLKVFLNRENCRTPMQWTPGRYRGFSSVKPWLPTLPSSEGRDVESQMKDPKSLLNCYSTLLNLRKTLLPLHKGSLQVRKSPRGILIYERCFNNESLVIVISFSRRTRSVPRPAPMNEVVFSTGDIPEVTGKYLVLPALSGVIIRKSH